MKLPVTVPVYSRSHYKAAHGLIAAIAACGLASSASAQFIKADNSNSLNLASSYTSNSTVPIATSTITFDNTLSTTSKTANLGGNLSVQGISATATPIGGATRQWGIGNTANATLTIGSGGITKAANTSAFVISSAIALGASQTWTLNAVTGTGTGNLQLNGTSFTDNGNTLAVNGAGVLDIRTVGNLTLGSAVTIDTTISINGNTATTNVTLGGSNTSNTVNIVAGKLNGATIGNFGAASAFGDGGTNTAITLGGGTVGQNGTMVYTGTTTSSNRTVSRDARSVGSGIEVTTAGETLTLSGAMSSGSQNNVLGSGWVFGGAGNLTLNGVINNSTTGNGTTITKNGSGTLTLGGNNTATGAVSVTEGTLVLSGTGSINNSSGITINGGSFKNNSSVNLTAPLTVTSGTVSGTNLAGVALNVGTNVVLSPGNSPGTLSAGATTFANGGSFLFEINDAAGTAGTSWDLLNATSLNITATGGGFTVSLASLVNPTNVAGNADGFVPDTSKAFLFVDTASPITSFSATAFTIDTSLFTNVVTGTWAIARGDTVLGGDNTQLFVTYTAIPEPSTFAALAGFGAIGLALYRRRASRRAA